MEPSPHRQRPPHDVPAGRWRSPDALHDADVVETGGHLPRWLRGGARGPSISLALVALVAGFVLGFIAAHPKPGTTGRTTMLPGILVVSATGSRCAVQQGHTLQLGIEIMNRSGSALVLRQIKPVLPMGGLREIASQWGTCGSLPLAGPGAGGVVSLAPGATGWLAVTFDVMIGCPQPVPVFFKVSFVQAGRLVTADFNSFPDLAQVRYNNCTTAPAG